MGNSEFIKEIETENFVWIIYLFIIGLSFLANRFEKDYYINEAKKLLVTLYFRQSFPLCPVPPYVQRIVVS